MIPVEQRTKKFKYTGEWADVVKWLDSMAYRIPVGCRPHIERNPITGSLIVQTPEGPHNCSKGEWVYVTDTLLGKAFRVSRREPK